ncbi:MAG: choice-of-anchor Q domain-containing protein [Chloroflexota bacterium]
MTNLILRRVAALAAAVSMLIVGAPSVAASGIVVSSLADNVANDGLCTLREAITSANTNTASGAARGECGAGGATDTITFAVAGTINISAKEPDLSSPMTIDGAGAIKLQQSGASAFFVTQASSTATLKGLTLTGGHVLYGGAVLNAGTLTIADSLITGNQADTWGGAIANANTATLIIRDSTISANQSGAGGAIHVGSGGSVQVIRSTLSANTAVMGGAIVSEGGSVTLANSTLSGNTATDGGGIFMASGALTLLNDTISGNSAAAAGGGIHVPGGSVVTVKNTIIAGNIGATFANVAGTIDTQVKSLVDVDVASVLDSAGLGDNGGPTATIGLLATAVTAIDKGDAATCAASPVSSLDQRSLGRPAACDIGAVERDKIAPTATAPKAALRSGAALTGSALGVHLAWTGADNGAGSGIAGYVVARSVNGDSYQIVSSSIAGPAVNVALASGATYRFRVRAVDHDGNQGAWVYGPTFSSRLAQQSVASVRYAGAWSTAANVGASGGSTRYATKAGASATYTFAGRSIAIVATRSAASGSMRVYVDGVLRGTVSLFAASTSYRAQVWQRTWASAGTHTVKIVVVGTAGHARVDLDAFAFLK